MAENWVVQKVVRLEALMGDYLVASSAVQMVDLMVDRLVDK